MARHTLMPAQTPIARRYVLLVLDDETAGVASLVRRARDEHQLEAEVVLCRSADEIYVRLGSGRPYSAVVASLDHPAADGGLVDVAARTATPVIVLGAGRRAPSGVTAQLTGPSPGALARALGASSTPVVLAGRPPVLGSPADLGLPGRARMIAVCGAGGAGTSTIAAALAAALAPGTAEADLLLADFALHADQVLFHGLAGGQAGSSLGLLDLIRVFGDGGVPMTGSRLRAHTLGVRGFRLLPGLRCPGHWTAVSPTAFDRLLGALCSAFGLVVADLTGEFEGERQVGSIDVEERNHMARRVAAAADLVIAVGRPGRGGGRRLLDTVADLLDLGVEPARIQPVVNRAARPGVAAGRLGGVPAPVLAIAEQAVDNGGLVAAELADPLGRVALSRLAHLPRAAREPVPVLVTPGSLGTWTGDRPA